MTGARNNICYLLSGYTGSSGILAVGPRSKSWSDDTTSYQIGPLVTGTDASYLRIFYRLFVVIFNYSLLIHNSSLVILLRIPTPMIMMMMIIIFEKKS